MTKTFLGLLLAGGAAVLVSTIAVAGEPQYCDPAAFAKTELSVPGSAIKRLHFFKVGQLSLAGMAIGDSRASDVIALAQKNGNPSAQEKYCTWYFNDGNYEAEKAFTWQDLPNPSFGNPSRIVSTYMSTLTADFDQAAVNFVSCAEKYHYVGLGCNGMMHRGPSVFAMFLAYSGCSADHSVAIVNKIWGSNGVPDQTRAALAQAAAQLGAQHPDAQKKLQTLLTAPRLTVQAE